MKGMRSTEREREREGGRERERRANRWQMGQVLTTGKSRSRILIVFYIPFFSAIYYSLFFFGCATWPEGS